MQRHSSQSCSDCLGASSVLAQPDDFSAYISGDRRSGYTFLTPETRALQNDEFANPGMLWVEQGSELWNAPAGPEGRSCATCHGQAKLSMRGVAARYPAYDAGSRRVINLEQRINMCRAERQGSEPLAYESRELLGITAFVANQSRGMPVAVSTGGDGRSKLRAADVTCSTPGSASSILPAATVTRTVSARDCAANRSARGRSTAFQFTASSGRRWARPTACSPGATKPSGPSPFRWDRRIMSTSSCSLNREQTAYLSRLRA